VDDDRAAFEWFRHYALLIAVMVLVGGGAGWVYQRLTPSRFEAWSIVIETGTAIGPLQLGPVAQAIFQTAAAASDVELRPVPSTTTLIVVGKGSTLELAEARSTAATDALLRAFQIQKLSKFARLPAQRAPTSSGPGLSTLIIIGATAGLWLGLGLAVLHYRLRRPILTLAAAMSVAGVDRVVVLEAARPRWGTSRRVRWRDDEGNRASLERFARGRTNGDAPDVVVPGAGRRQRAHVVRRWRRIPGLGGGFSEEPPGGWTVLVCDPSTRRSDLARSRSVVSGSADTVDLVWIR
jgi:hypothetical protein